MFVSISFQDLAMLPSSSARIGSVWISPECVTMWRTAVTTVMNLDVVRSMPVFFLYLFNKHINISNALLICALYTNPTVMPTLQTL